MSPLSLRGRECAPGAANGWALRGTHIFIEKFSNLNCWQDFWTEAAFSLLTGTEILKNVPLLTDMKTADVTYYPIVGARRVAGFLSPQRRFSGLRASAVFGRNARSFRRQPWAPSRVLWFNHSYGSDPPQTNPALCRPGTVIKSIPAVWNILLSDNSEHSSKISFFISFSSRTRSNMRTRIFWGIWRSPPSLGSSPILQTVLK